MSGKPKWGWHKQWNAQHGRCWICLEPMRLEPPQHPMTASIEHIVPLARGGGGTWRNKLLAHQLCNGQRGAPFVWVKLKLFRRAAMKRVRGLVRETTVDGIDLGSSHRSMRSAKTIRLARRSATGPSEMAVQALRVPLAELASRKQSAKE